LHGLTQHAIAGAIETIPGVTLFTITIVTPISGELTLEIFCNVLASFANGACGKLYCLTLFARFIGIESVSNCTLLAIAIIAMVNGQHTLFMLTDIGTTFPCRSRRKLHSLTLDTFVFEVQPVSDVAMLAVTIKTVISGKLTVCMFVNVPAPLQNGSCGILHRLTGLTSVICVQSERCMTLLAITVETMIGS